MITLSNTVMQALLIAVVVLPLLGSAAALLPPPPGLQGRSPQQAVLRHGVTVTGVVLAAAVVLALGFDTERPGTVQAESDVEWIPALGTHLHLGVDGVSLPLLVLTALLTFLCALYSYGAGTRPPAAGDIRAEDTDRTDGTDGTDGTDRTDTTADISGTAGDDDPADDAADVPAAPRTGSPQSFVALLLLLEAGMLATFATLDLLLFFLAFETVLVPMYFLIARWGGGQRAAAAWKFILYTLLGSVVMLLGLLLVGIRSGTFDMVALATDSHPALTGTTQLVAALAIGIGLAVKTPMWPLHSWLPDAHTAAPTVGSVLLAGVLLKMGTYGFVRILLPVAPDGLHTLAPYLAALAVTGILYGSLACLALARRGAGGDLKRLIAYSSVGHMGFVLLGIATMTPTGVNGALFANIAHGLITGLLFFLVGALKERTGSTDLDTLSGGTAGTGGALYGTVPRLGGLFAFGAVASLGLPGLAGFWGEMLALFGAYEPAAGLNRPAFLACMSLGALGTLLTAAYLLVVVRRVCMGEPHGAPGAVERPQLHDPEPESRQEPDDATEPGAETDPDKATDREADRDDEADPDAETAPEEEAEAAGATESDATAEPQPSKSAEPEPEPSKPTEPESKSGKPGPGKPESPEPAPAPEPATTATPAPAPMPAPTPASATTPAPVLTPVRLPDIRAYEYASWTPLVVLTVATGLWPALLLGLSDPAVQSLLPGVDR